MTARSTMDHWAREIEAFESHLSSGPGTDYVSWQPTKWQSLLTLRDRLLRTCWDGQPGPEATALELGCGSATLLLQLQEHGVRCTGVDRDPTARALAARAARTLGVPVPRLLDVDFTDPQQVATLPKSDLVFHIGVIEHFDEATQLELLRLSAALSHRWVLIGIPHEHGPVFSGFLKAVTAADAVYDDEHEHIDVPSLVERAGYRLAHRDGLHMFYSEPSLYTSGDPALDGFYDELRPLLVQHGGERYAAFPHVAFDRSDVPVLRAVEEGLAPEVRYANGFIRYYLVDTAS